MFKNILILFFLVSILVGCSENKGPAPYNPTPDSLILDPNYHPEAKNVTVYGLSLGTYHGGKLDMMTDVGDTIQIKVAGSHLKGTPQMGDRLAVMFGGTGKPALSVINTTKLLGRWLMPNPIDGSSMVGIEIKEGGIAESIEQSSIEYQTWRIFNGKLVITSLRDGGIGDVFTDYYTIRKLTADSLVYYDNEQTYDYVRSKNN